MGCRGCGPGDKGSEYDKHGNRMEHPAEVQERARHAEHRRAHGTARDQARELSYAEYTRRRAEFREQARVVRDKAIAEFSDDYKRIQIDELISVYNLEEVHFKLTPEQALVALWEFVHDKGYQKVIDEFEGLREAIDKRYVELQKNKIELKWRP